MNERDIYTHARLVAETDGQIYFCSLDNVPFGQQQIVQLSGFVHINLQHLPGISQSQLSKFFGLPHQLLPVLEVCHWCEPTQRTELYESGTENKVLSQHAQLQVGALPPSLQKLVSQHHRHM